MIRAQTILVTFAILLFSTQASATCSIYHNGILYLSGTPQSGLEMVVVDGTISELSDADSSDEDLSDGQPCQRIDLNGAFVTPGFIEVSSKLGLVEVGMAKPSVDHDGGGDDPNRAALVIGEAYNPLSSLIPIARTGGVATAVIAPDGGFVSGQSALVSLWGDTQAESVLDWSTSMHARMHLGESRATGIQTLRHLLDEARSFANDPRSWDESKSHQADTQRADIVAMTAVLRQEIPIVIPASRASDIEALIRLKESYDIDLVIQGGAEAWVHASALSAANIGVIINPMNNGAGGFEHRLGRADNAALLESAGVQIILSNGDTHNARNLRFSAGNSVRAGLPHEAAIRAITENPARLFGHPELGSLSTGSEATFAVWTGDPFEPMTRLKMLVIRGTETSTSTRQQLLFERYRRK